MSYQPAGAVGYISYNMGTFNLPEIYALALGRCAPSCSCIYFRQITRAHVITTTKLVMMFQQFVENVSKNSFFGTEGAGKT